MSRARKYQPGWSWLLVMLLFCAVVMEPVARVRPAAAGCAGRPGAAAHSCCCAGHRLGQCCCAGHEGTAAQLACLTSCGGGRDLPAFLLALPPALLLSIRVSPAPRPSTRAVPLPAPVFTPPACPEPPTPPPEAA